MGGGQASWVGSEVKYLSAPGCDRISRVTTKIWSRGGLGATLSVQGGAEIFLVVSLPLHPRGKRR